jgi:hypothetical protein
MRKLNPVWKEGKQRAKTRNQWKHKFTSNWEN